MYAVLKRCWNPSKKRVLALIWSNVLRSSMHSVSLSTRHPSRAAVSRGRFSVRTWTDRCLFFPFLLVHIVSVVHFQVILFDMKYTLAIFLIAALLSFVAAVPHKAEYDYARIARNQYNPKNASTKRLRARAPAVSAECSVDSQCPGVKVCNIRRCVTPCLEGESTFPVSISQKLETDLLV